MHQDGVGRDLPKQLSACICPEWDWADGFQPPDFELWDSSTVWLPTVVNVPNWGLDVIPKIPAGEG